MNLPLMTMEAVSQLEAAVVANVASYQSGNTAQLIPAPSVRASKVEVDSPPALVRGNGELESDAAAARLIFRWLQKLDATQAADARLWTYLTHVTFADYVHQRWSRGLEGSTDPERLIAERWFFRGIGSATYFRNGLARLWWFGRLTYDATRGDHFELTDVLLSLQDLQQAFLERSLGRCRPLLHRVLETYKDCESRNALGGGRSEKVKAWAVEINKAGGSSMLDALPPDRLKAIVERSFEVAFA